MKDFLQDRPSLSLTSRSAATAAARPASTPVLTSLRQEKRVVHEPTGTQPRVETVHEDGRVTRILITCADGNLIELDCHYGRA